MTNDKNPLDDIGLVPHCKRCGSERVVRDAWACWNRASGLWELEHVFDDEYCHSCEEQTHLEWTRPEMPSEKSIVELNDQLRIHGTGGTIMVTSGVQGLGQKFINLVFDALRSFNSFSEDNDPYGEQDFGAMQVDGEKVFWKIDCYDLSMTAHSPNAANPGVTKRVLTVMLAGEY